MEKGTITSQGQFYVSYFGLFPPSAYLVDFLSSGKMQPAKSMSCLRVA